ncbi:MAG: MFS transporter [Novosphingobium sp.]|nr:MFS transporter [Novosphingobium sp.]
MLGKESPRCHCIHVSEPTSPIQIPDFRRFWLSRFASMIATTGMVVIIGYQLYDIARSDYAMSIPQAALQLGLLGLAQFVPLMLLTPIAGLVADRFDRRYVAAIAIATDLTIALALATSTWMGVRNLPLLFAFAALHGSVRVFVNPAVSAIAPNIVPAKLIPRAIALNSIAWQAGAVAGPAIFGFLFASDAALPYWTASVLLVLSCIGILTIGKMARHQDDVGKAKPLRQIIGGFQFVWNERFLLGCITLDLFAVLLGGATALLPVFARDILQVGPEGLGQMRAAPAVGAALVALWMSWKPLENNVGLKMLLAVAVFGAMTAAFGISRSFALSLVLLALLGAADMISVFVRSSLVQLNTPNDVRGRVSAISGLAISASNELGEMQSGVAAALLGVSGAVVFGGVGAIVVTALWAWIFPELLRAKTFAPQYRQREPDP